ncbi:hypothetical protein MMC25_005521 [Agyrium rufum]|nr:hypothetical protein [Agyrium rufum]
MSVAAEADIREPANVEPDSSPPRSSPFRSSPTPTPETPFRGISSTDITEQYRGILSRLSPLPSNLLPLPSGASYTILIETTARDGAPIGNPQPWIPAEARDGRSATASEETSSDSGHNQSKHLPQTQIHGIRSLRAGTGPNLYTMECFVEETQRKAHLLDEQRQKAADEAMIKKVERTREFADLKREIEKTVRRGEVVGEQAREEQEEEDESSGLLGKASSSEGTTDSSAPNRSGQLP